MKKNIKEELQDIKFLFNYKAGKVLSEQSTDDVVSFDMNTTEMEEQREVQIPVRPDVDTPTRPSKPATPYKPKPGVKPSPKAKLPKWLTFNSIGIKLK